LCAPAARRIPFEAIGIAPHSQLFDIALSADRVWLLVDFNHLIELWRNSEERLFRRVEGREEAYWEALDVDPVDGSLWIVSTLRLELIHLVPDGRSHVVQIPRLEGEGGFRDVLVEESGIWVVPTCAQHALWKVDRQGKLLEQAFHRQGEEPLTLRETFTPEESAGSVRGCVPVSLARDPEGRIAVFDGVSRAFYRREEDDWKPFLEIPAIPEEAVPSGGVTVLKPGTADQAWSPVGTSSGEAPPFFFVGDSPVFRPDHRPVEDFRAGFLRYERPGPEGLTVTYERCDARSYGGTPVVATDRDGFVTYLADQVVLGVFPKTD
jgi:hypothetical protein